MDLWVLKQSPRMVKILKTKYMPPLDPSKRGELLLYNRNGVRYPDDMTGYYIQTHQEEVFNWMKDLIQTQERISPLVPDLRENDMASLQSRFIPIMRSFLQSAYFAEPGKLQRHGQLIRVLTSTLFQREHQSVLYDYTFGYFLQNLQLATSKQIPIEVHKALVNHPEVAEEGKLLYNGEVNLLIWYTVADALSRLALIPWEAELAELAELQSMSW